MTDGRKAAVPKVYLTQALKDLLADNSKEQQLISDFLAWKKSPQSVYLFGRDAGGIKGQEPLRHVHLVPLMDPERLRRWDRDWTKRLPDRTSDRYLFYADGTPSHGYLLLLIVNDPGAHQIWANKKLVESLVSLADDFVFFGKLPD